MITRELTAPCTDYETASCRVRIGSILGEIAPGFITAELAQYCDDGQEAVERRRNVSTWIPEELRDAVDRFKRGMETLDDLHALYDLILNSDEARAHAT